MPQGTKLDLGRLLAQLRPRDPFTAEALQHLQDAVNRLADSTAASPIGELPPPPPVDSISVKGTLVNNVLTAPGEILHVVHTHNAPINRNIRYLTEIDTDPSFPAPHQILDTTSRSGFVHLPANDDANQPVAYYLRVTPQYPGSTPARPTVYGGSQGPTQILMTGTTRMSLLPSQAGGTARPGQGGFGLGPVRSRGPVGPVGGPKRQLG